MKNKVLTGLLIGILLFSTAFADTEKKTIRVGISNQSFSSWEYKNADFISENIIKIIDMAQNVEIENIKANTLITITYDEMGYSIYINGENKYSRLVGPLLLSSNAQIGIVNLNRKGTPAKYKGMIEIKTSKSNKGFNIINVVDMDNYLRGVVPNEMPVSFGLEALKAQTIAARNYANNANISPNYYDVVDSTASQVYYGANSYKDITDEAVLKTKGIYALYKNKPITALYFSTSPGITDDWDDVFSDGFNIGIHPYLKPKYDLNNKPLKTEGDIEDFYTRNDNGLDINSPKFRWNIEFDRSELEKVLSQTLVQQSNTGLVSPKYDGIIPITGLREIKPLKRTSSGKITELLIVCDNGEFKVKKELGIRRVLKKNNAMLPSANFFIQTRCTNVGHKIMGLFDFEHTYPDAFTFIGGGFGHGVGMSQFGAYSMAKSGKKYPEILNHYYTDIELSTIPKTVFYNEYNIRYNTEFYYEPKTYSAIYLFIKNNKNASEFNFKINDTEFSDTSKFANNRLIKINITQYLKEGINTISFAPLTIKNKGKIIEYQVEFVNGK